MWVIVINKSISEKRDDRISELFGDNTNKRYLSRHSGRYYSTIDIKSSLIFKKQSGAIRIINNFNSQNNNFHSSQFFNINESILSIEKIDKEQWNNIIEFEILKLDIKYQKQRKKLVCKLTEYK